MDFGDSEHIIPRQRPIHRVSSSLHSYKTDSETLHIGDILKKLQKLQAGIESLRLDMGEISSETFCRRCSPTSESKFSLLSEMMSGYLLGKADEIRVMLEEMKAEINGKAVDLGEMLEYKKLEREVNRIYPDLVRTVNLVACKDYKLASNGSKEQITLDRNLVTNVRTQRRGGTKPPTNMTFILNKRAEEVADVDEQYKQIVMTTEKCVETYDKFIKKIDAILEEDLKGPERRVVSTKRTVTKTEDLGGQEPIEEVLMNVRITRQIDNETGEVVEVVSDLEVENEREKFSMHYYPSPPPNTTHPSESSQYPTSESDFHKNFYRKSSDRDLREEVMHDMNSVDGSRMINTFSVVRNEEKQANYSPRQQAGLENRISSYFEILCNKSPQEMKESNLRCYNRLSKLSSTSYESNITKYSDVRPPKPVEAIFIEPPIHKLNSEPTVSNFSDISEYIDRKKTLRRVNKKSEEAIKSSDFSRSLADQSKRVSFRHDLIEKSFPPPNHQLRSTTSLSVIKTTLVEVVSEDVDSEVPTKPSTFNVTDIGADDSDITTSVESLKSAIIDYHKRENKELRLESGAAGPSPKEAVASKNPFRLILPSKDSNKSKNNLKDAPKKSKSNELYKARRFLNISVIETTPEEVVIPKKACNYTVGSKVMQLTNSEVDVICAQRAKWLREEAKKAN
ncbi:unnamed protein product [Hermetia illucens]|uniref:Uncharacterized protein n=1 Tax=Hermetia illucens TaxID=343691 RepID=A0A7R8YND3_HERIL|nr:unnamed protein product [Hermetia illucens]